MGGSTRVEAPQSVLRASSLRHTSGLAAAGVLRVDPFPTRNGRPMRRTRTRTARPGAPPPPPPSPHPAPAAPAAGARPQIRVPNAPRVHATHGTVAVLPPRTRVVTM